MSWRPIFVSAAGALLLGVVALRIPWVRPTGGGLTCHGVFSAPPQLYPLPSAPGSYILSLRFKSTRPALEVVFQELGPQGHGWLTWRIPSSASRSLRLTIDGLSRHRVRVGVMSLAEFARVQSIRSAAARFDLAAWRAARGWVAPAVDICRDITVGNGHD